MDRELRDKLDEYVRVRLTEKRYTHTMGVVETATGLARRYGVDEDKADMAALFHDACKNLDIDEMNTLVEYYEIGDVYIDKPQLAHSKLAAAIIRDRFGVDDEDVINAISFHTTGREGMSTLEKIVYVADATEPNRTYADAKRLNALAYDDLDMACYEVAKYSLEILDSSGKYIDQDTVRAFRYFESIINESSFKNSRYFAAYLAKVLDDKKGEDITVLDISEKSSFADYFIIATGGSLRQLNAMADEVDDKASASGRMPRGTEGKNGSGWVLVDFGDVVVNLFTEDKRGKYDLERIWSDCESVDWEAEVK